METIIIRDLTEYVKFLEREIDSEDVLFRGQELEQPLLPKIGRSNLFLRKQNKLIAEKEMFNEFKRRAVIFMEQLPSTDWDWLALAQHNGLATRLLDWTKNALAALWFAVKMPPSNMATNAVVWIFRVNDTDIVNPLITKDPFAIQKTKVFRPTQITDRLIAQDGWFTVHAYKPSTNGFIAFNRHIFYKGRLTKLTIPADKFAKIRDSLASCGINSSSLFPELPGLCDHIVWDSTVASDEAGMKGAILKGIARPT